MYSLLLALIYLAFISLGLPDSLLGAGWSQMHAFFGVPLASAGIVSMIISFGTVISSLAAERINRRLGTKYVTLISVLTTAAALLGFSFSGSFTAVCLWAVPYGLGAGSVDAALNNYVALHYTSRHMSWLHCFWGVGAIISPNVMSLALTYGTWQSGYRWVSAAQFSIALVLALTLPVWRINRSKAEEADRRAPAVGLIGALKIKGVPLVLAGFLCYCAAESTAMLWVSSYLIGTRSFEPSAAAAFASFFYLGLTGGRFLSGLISNRLGDRNMIRLGTAVMALGIILTLIPALPDPVTLAGLLVIGLGCAPIYPSIIHATPKSFGENNSQAIIGMQMASAYTGSTLAPPIFGWLSTFTGLWFMPVYLALFGALMIFMLESAFIRARNRGT